MGFFENFSQNLPYTDASVAKSIDSGNCYAGVVSHQGSSGEFKYRLLPGKSIGFDDDATNLRIGNVLSTQKINNVWVAGINVEAMSGGHKGFATTILRSADLALARIGSINKARNLNPRLLFNRSDGQVTWSTYLTKASEIVYREENIAIFFP